MAFTYNLATNGGKVRLLIADTDADNFDFSDEEIAVALDQCSNSLRRAGAWLLTALANNRARLAVSVRRGDVSEDLTRVADALREQAKWLIAEEENATDGPLLAIINPTTDRFAAKRNHWFDRDERVTEAP